MINHEREFIFVHVPKTAGTSMECVLGDPNGWKNKKKYFLGGKSRQHYSIKQMLNIFPESKDYFKFAFVRNPWDRLVSEYFYAKSLWSRGWKNTPESSKKFESFKAFVLCDNDKFNLAFHCRSQLSFLVDESGEVVVDYVGRFENLQNDFDVVCDKIGMDTLSLPRALETQHEHYTEYYDSETREHVGLRYKEDIEYFGYEF